MSKEEILKKLIDTMVEIEDDEVMELVDEALEAGLEPLEIISDGLQPGLTIIGEGFDKHTRFTSDLVYSLILSALVYPIVVHWVWGGGWLAQLGFVDFAGSTVVHSLGGWAGLMGTLALGARLGRFID